MLLGFITFIVILLWDLHKLIWSEADNKKVNTKEKESDIKDNKKVNESDVRNAASANWANNELLCSPNFFRERQRKYAYVGGVCHFLNYDSEKDVYSLVINGREKPIDKKQIQSAFNVTRLIIGYKGVMLVSYQGILYPFENTYEAHYDAAHAFGGDDAYYSEGPAYARGEWYFCRHVNDLNMRDVTSIEEVREPVNNLPFNTEEHAVLLSGRNNWSADVYQFLLNLAENKNM